MVIDARGRINNNSRAFPDNPLDDRLSLFEHKALASLKASVGARAKLGQLSYLGINNTKNVCRLSRDALGRMLDGAGQLVAVSQIPLSIRLALVLLLSRIWVRFLKMC